MNRRPTFVMTIIAVLCFGLLVPRSGALAQQKTLKEQLVGAWTLVSSNTTGPDGTKQQPFGANPRGILLLDAGGQYAAVLERPERPKFKDATDLRSEATVEEFAAAAREFAANFGTWSVNEVDKTLTRRLEGALIPNAEGTESKASVSLAGDELTIAIIPAAGGRNETVYRRAK